MTPRTGTVALLACGLAISAAAAIPVDPLTQFTGRVEQYVALRARLEEPLPAFTRPRANWSGFLAKRFLASAIREARREARPGDIFTPAAAALFRERLAGAVSPAERLLLPNRAAGEEGTPLVVVNEPLAPEWLTMLPPVALAALPGLPAGLEFRLMDADLVLWDAHADIVVDVLPDAVR